MKARSPLCETPAEELASSITHIIGAVLSVIALVFMIIVAQGDSLKITSGVIFGSSLIILYLSSTLYHSFCSPRVKSFFQIIDHSAIYLLIVWAMAIGGILAKSLMKKNRDHWLSTALYVVMGWLAIFAIKPLYQQLPIGGLTLIVAGGLFYTGGVVFFLKETLKYNHAIWHLFVLAGSVCHALATILYIL